MGSVPLWGLYRLVHTAHVGVGGGGGRRLGQIGDQALGGQDHGCNAGSILQSGAGDLGRVDDAGLLLFQNRYDPPAAPTPTPAPAKTTPVPAHPAPKSALPKSTLPQTADPMPVTLLATLAVLSAGGLMGLYYNKYGRKERK